MSLKTNYRDDVLDTSANERRKYQMVNNPDGTISLVDVTVYATVGDTFGAVDINATNGAFGGMKLLSLTQAQYNALSVKDANTLYFTT